ncbi:hypothetical protein HOLleu_12673 [Holothuria leucospilota]|uniref:Sulfotransferase n=1 Tax=Holothuria leucospilota TaxID=206669 RepID=A0A9Q1CBM8_HOLLE|nr:hypothetical protein HOLleu_12673 [Holothuria leucospilota]
MFHAKNPSRWISLAKFAASSAAIITAIIFLHAMPSHLVRYQLESFQIFHFKGRASLERSASFPSTKDANQTVDARLTDPVPRTLKTAEGTNYFQSSVQTINLNNYLPNAYLYRHLAKPYNTSILTFVHNPKSGGSSLKQCMLGLYRAMNKNKPVVVAMDTVGEEMEKLLNHVTPPNDYYMGDAALGICDSVDDRPCSYFTVVREPFERAISHYYFCKNGGDGCPPSVTTLEEFTMSSCSLFFRQLTSRVLCKEDKQNTSLPWKCDRIPISIDHLSPNQQEREMLLKYFLENVDKIFAVIGLTEEFETSLKLLEDTFGEPFHELCHKKHANAGSYKKVGDKDVTEAVRERIISEAKEMLMKNEQISQCMHEDVQLYNKMYEIFQKQKQFIDEV